VSDVIVVAVDEASLATAMEERGLSDAYEAMCEVSRCLAPLAQAGHGLVVTLAGQRALDEIVARVTVSSGGVDESPLDVCGAQAQGAVAYQLQQALTSEFKLRGIEREAAAVMTRVEVDIGDAAFLSPDRPVGGAYTAEEAQGLSASEGWRMTEHAGVWRRLAACPRPRRIVDIGAIRALMGAGFVVLAGSGGGVPVVLDERGWYMGSAAVLDEALTASLLARELGASTLMLTCADAETAQGVAALSLDALRQRRKDRTLEGLSPARAQAIEAFLAGGGRQVVIAGLSRLEEALGDAGVGRRFVG